MRAVFMVMTVVYASTGEPVKEPLSWRFPGVTIDECRALLETEKEYDESFKVDPKDDPIVRDRKIVIHSLRFLEWRMEDPVKTSEPMEVAMTCEEREVEE
jgi:hypothetical protein